MSISSKSESRLLNHEDQELVRKTHHPAIHEHSRDELHDLRQRLRTARDRERTLHHQKVRETRGKAEPRGGSFPGVADHPAQRKQLFAQALKRVNSEVSRLRRMEARAVHTGAAQRALALRKAGAPTARPANEPTAHTGASSTPSARRKSHVPGGKVGSVSQANKRAQAAKDKRPGKSP
jgi:hypothetical protein